MEDRETACQIIALLLQRWLENPAKPFGYIVAQMAYNGAGHTEMADVTDEQMFKGLRHGWRPL